MKAVKSFFVVSLAWGIAAICFSFFLYDPDLQYSNPTSLTYQFDFGSNLDAQGSEGDDNWQVFLSLGDGTFWKGSKADFDAMTFTYSAAGTYQAYAEITPTYDDNDKPPKALYRTVTVSSGNVSTQSPISVIMGNDAVRLQSTRDPKKNDIITYIITYAHNQPNCRAALDGTLNFYFDKDVMTYEGVDLFHTDNNKETPPSATTSAINNSGTLTVSFEQLAQQEQRSIFLRFRTNDLASGTIMETKPKVDFSAEWTTSVGACSDITTITDSDELTAQQITLSHDPNKKFAIQSHICEDAQYVDFTVTFQNDGPGMTSSVKVLDELDKYLERSIPTMLSWDTPQQPSLSWESTDPDERTVVFDFPNLQLHGMNEPGYGTAFDEDATKATFTFRCQIDSNQAYCNAILNRAKVFFDCNPPINTSLATAHINCTNCLECSVVAPDTTVTDTFILGNNILSDALALWIGDHDRYHWYPSEGLNNAAIKNPGLTDLKHREYTLVASSDDPCRYMVIHVGAFNLCNLDMEIVPQITGGLCAGGGSGQLTATVSGYEGTPSQLQWHLCNVTGVTCSMPYQSGQTEYHFGVTDLSTGCTLEQKFIIQEPSPLQVDDAPTDCKANLVISGGTPPYTVNWIYQDQQGQTQTASGPVLLGLRNKTTVKATVTDANGCTKVFYPQKANCNRSLIGYLIGALALAVVSVIVWKIIKKP